MLRLVSNSVSSQVSSRDWILSHMRSCSRSLILSSNNERQSLTYSKRSGTETVYQSPGLYSGSTCIQTIVLPHENLFQAGDQRFVLRKKPTGSILASAHAVDREYRVLQALKPTEVPVPQTRALCDNDAVLGTPFYIMDYVQVRLALPTTVGSSSRSQTLVKCDSTRSEVFSSTCMKQHKIRRSFAQYAFQFPKFSTQSYCAVGGHHNV